MLSIGFMNATYIKAIAQEQATFLSFWLKNYKLMAFLVNVRNNIGKTTQTM
jgi:hypothetical protein